MIHATMPSHHFTARAIAIRARAMATRIFQGGRFTTKRCTATLRRSSRDTRVGQYFGDDDHGSHDDDFDDPPSSGGRGGFFTIIAVLCLAVVGTAGAFAYRSMVSGSGPNNPPVILADATPQQNRANAPVG